MVGYTHLYSYVNGYSKTGDFCKDFRLELPFRLKDGCTVFQEEIYANLKAIIKSVANRPGQTIYVAINDNDLICHKCFFLFITYSYSLLQDI